IESPRGRLFVAVDRDGKLREFDPATGQSTLIEGRPELLVPGGVVRTLPNDGNEFFLIDRRGNLVSYVRDPLVRWKGPRLIANEFSAGSDLVAWRHPDHFLELRLAAVNLRGEACFGRWDPTGWR